jgi:hypothetical protein
MRLRLSDIGGFCDLESGAKSGEYSIMETICHST